MNRRKFFLFFYLLILPSIVLAQSTLVRQLETLVEELPVGSIYSIQVRDPVSGKVLFEDGEQQNLVPASVLKVLTATLAYEALGEEFRYVTRFESTRSVRQGIVKGPVVLKFSGDPSLTHDNIRGLIKELKERNVRTIDSNLWIDGGVFSGYDRAGGVSWDDLNICFAAPAAAMVLDRNCFYAWLKPGRKEGQKTRIEYDNSDWGLTVENKVITTEKDCPLSVFPSAKHEYKLEGCVSPGSRSVRLAFSISNVERAVRKFILTELRKSHIQLKGRILVGRPDQETPIVLAEHQSELLPMLLKPVLEKSDNLYSDSILKTVAYAHSGEPGNYAAGIQSARELLGEGGVGFGSSRLVDGSGLSRYNFISASTLVDVLMFGWSRWGEQSPWLLDRTKKERWLKTGYMSGVSSMAGYVFQEDEKPLVFAVILNGLMPPLPASREEMRAFRKSIRSFHQSFLKVLSTADKG
ncbi:D-alanyl-D-alanine carboxypeptidase/D-alanyl-D-alanine-endopeptidase [Endozoicomonas sp. OPT23]|uniref:D-alanyl-D-alanine carboxypeptidase/D-alanyl-D-alanine endopeptidase n=1 Tax=Endozoicomonas sp. OPT23 TaxID=2072845 RepID=UPI0018913C78